MSPAWDKSLDNVFFLQNAHFGVFCTLSGVTAPLLLSRPVGVWLRQESVASDWEVSARVDARPDNDAAGVWTAVSARLKDTLSESTWSTWFAERLTRRDRRDDDRGLRPERLLAAVDRGPLRRAGDRGRARCRRRPARRPLPGRRAGRGATPGRAAARSSPGSCRRGRRRRRRRPARAPRTPPHPLTGKYTFDHFVIGSSNRFAHAAALAVAEAPAQAYNPLFIYGATGLGKTHLLQAIVALPGDRDAEPPRALPHRRGVHERLHRRICRTNVSTQFKARYRTYDVLLIDDIQFFAGKERIQEEFFHTFNSVYEAGGQIVLSLGPAAEGDHGARGTAALALRVGADHGRPAARSRDPDRDPASKKAERRRRSGSPDNDRPGRDRPAHPDEHPRARGRPHAGRRVRLAERRRRHRGPGARRAPRPVPRGRAARHRGGDPEGRGRRTSTSPAADLRGDRRTQNVVYPRQLAMYLCRELTDLSLPKIGQRFGGRDHTTVHYAEGKIAAPDPRGPARVQPRAGPDGPDPARSLSARSIAEPR